MLDRAKLMHAFAKVQQELFEDDPARLTTVLEAWERLQHTVVLQERVRALRSLLPISLWQTELASVFPITRIDGYTVVASDGSQVYPDRHMPGQSCFLINIGYAQLHYGARSGASFRSEPYIFTAHNVLPAYGHSSFSSELVDFKREELEFAALYELAGEQRAGDCVSLVDGSLIFWHLESGSSSVGAHFLKAYLFYLERFYAARMAIAGYISFPKTKDLSLLVRAVLCTQSDPALIANHDESITCPCAQAQAVIDTTLVRSMLAPGERTTLFRSGAKVADAYPEHLRPYFCYMHVGQEIARLEVPAWVAHDPLVLERVCAVALDQSRKGYGYPVSLAEAHEQAVVKGPDREFFYHVLMKLGMARSWVMESSQKSLKKKRIGI